MGRKNKSYSKDLHQQAYEKLTSMLALGESKREAVLNGTADDKIFSVNTYKTYWKHIKYFLKYVKEKYPECTTLKKAKRYVNEWLQVRVDQDLSAWTIQAEAKALGKLYGIKPDDGLRRSELADLKGTDLVTREQIEAQITALEQIPEQQRTPGDTKRLQMLQDTRMFEGEYFVHVRNGKGGRERVSPIIGKNQTQIIDRMKNTSPDEKVWQFIHQCADIHSYRSDYAVAIYKAHARKISEIPFDRVNKGTGKRYQSDVYTCRKDEAGKKLDKAAMLVCSKALGHNRISVVADNYIRGL